MTLKPICRQNTRLSALITLSLSAALFAVSGCGGSGAADGGGDRGGSSSETGGRASSGSSGNSGALGGAPPTGGSGASGGTSGDSAAAGSNPGGAAAGGTAGSIALGGASGVGGTSSGGHAGQGAAGSGQSGGGTTAGAAGSIGTGTCTASKAVTVSASGSGPHQVTVETNADPGIREGTIYRPKDLGGGEKYPIFVWGNGACSQDGLSNTAAMAEIASHGYFLIADGTPKGTGGRSQTTNWVAMGKRPVG